MAVCQAHEAFSGKVKYLFLMPTTFYLLEHSHFAPIFSHFESEVMYVTLFLRGGTPSSPYLSGVWNRVECRHTYNRLNQYGVPLCGKNSRTPFSVKYVNLTDLFELFLNFVFCSFSLSSSNRVINLLWDLF